MGGTGSGRRRGEGSMRVTTDEVPALDVRDLKRKGLIAAGQERVGVVTRFRKRSRANLAPGEKRIVELVAHLRLTWTPCNYGGSRPWILCDGCGRRVAIVYGPASPPLCRLCRGLIYASQLRLSNYLRTARRR
jgi:hypothetical protein